MKFLEIFWSGADLVWVMLESGFAPAGANLGFGSCAGDVQQGVEVLGRRNMLLEVVVRHDVQMICWCSEERVLDAGTVLYALSYRDDKRDRLGLGPSSAHAEVCRIDHLTGITTFMILYSC